MNKRERRAIVSDALAAIAKELLEVNAAGPCGYWNRQLADRLNQKALELVKSPLPRQKGRPKYDRNLNTDLEWERIK